MSVDDLAIYGSDDEVSAPVWRLAKVQQPTTAMRLAIYNLVRVQTSVEHVVKVCPTGPVLRVLVVVFSNANCIGWLTS